MKKGLIILFGAMMLTSCSIVAQGPGPRGQIYMQTIPGGYYDFDADISARRVSDEMRAMLGLTNSQYRAVYNLYYREYVRLGRAFESAGLFGRDLTGWYTGIPGYDVAASARRIENRLRSILTLTQYRIYLGWMDVYDPYYYGDYFYGLPPFGIDGRIPRRDRRYEPRPYQYSYPGQGPARGVYREYDAGPGRPPQTYSTPQGQPQAAPNNAPQQQRQRNQTQQRRNEQVNPPQNQQVNPPQNQQQNRSNGQNSGATIRRNGTVINGQGAQGATQGNQNTQNRQNQSGQVNRSTQGTTGTGSQNSTNQNTTTRRGR